MKIGVTLPLVNQPWDKVVELAKLADSAGLESLWDYEVHRNPFTTHTLVSQHTTDIKIATGIAATLSRTPYEMANAAVDVDELSGGRMVLGIGIGTPGLSDAWHGVPIDKPVARIRDYVGALRVIFRHFATGEELTHDGPYYRYGPPLLDVDGPRAPHEESIPIYLGALRPKMTQLAGEIADGMVGFLFTPAYIQQSVLPNLRIGAERVGRDPTACDLASFTICSISDDRAEAIRRARIQVGAYAAHPVCAPIAALHGVEADIAPVAERVFAGDIRSLQDVTSDSLVETFSITGTPDEAREQIKVFEGVLPHLALHPPYISALTQEETEDAFRAIVETFGR